MNGEGLAEVVGAYLATSQSRADPWHRVARGELSPHDAEREWMARREGLVQVEPDELERMKQVFSPPSARRRREVLEMLLAERARPNKEDAGATDPTETKDHDVVRLRPRRWTRWIGGLAAAAAVLAVLSVRSPRAPGPFVGGYELELEHVTATMRGTDEPADVPTFTGDGKLGLRLVPEEAVAEPVGVVAFATGPGGEIQRLDLEPIVHANGVVEISATVKELGLREGRWELVVAIGWADSLPESWEGTTAAETTEAAQIIRRRIRVKER